MRALATVLLCFVVHACGTVTPCGGCVDKDGVCQAGAARTACGTNGAACLNCAFASQQCVAGACVAPDAGVGGGSPGGGRAGGAAGGGFVAAGGSAGGSSIPDGSVQVTFEWDGLECQTATCPDCTLKRCEVSRILNRDQFFLLPSSIDNMCPIESDGGVTAVVRCAGRCTITQGVCAGRMSTYGTCANVGGMRDDCALAN